MFRFLSAEGMDFLALPAAFTEATGRAHWRTIVHARAIDLDRIQKLRREFPVLLHHRFTINGPE